MAELLSQATHAAILAERKGELKGAEKANDALREAYLKILEKPNWMQLIREAGRDAIITLSRSSRRTQSTETPFQIQFEKSSYSFPADTETIVIGRLEGCDIAYPNVPETSRIACVVYLCPETSEYAIVDVGGLFGWTLFDHEKKQEIMQSRPHQRRMAIEQWTSIRVLQHGRHSFVLQPKLCDICCEGTREVRFNCGHKYVCRPCSEKLSVCPYCRKPIQERHEGYSMGSYVA